MLTNDVHLSTTVEEKGEIVFTEANSSEVEVAAREKGKRADMVTAKSTIEMDLPTSRRCGL